LSRAKSCTAFLTKKVYFGALAFFLAIFYTSLKNEGIQTRFDWLIRLFCSNYRFQAFWVNRETPRLMDTNIGQQF
ncbi:MAG: hypothetical protein ACXABD_06675, partial [Candidatus Thorarchaeota archaeon]